MAYLCKMISGRKGEEVCILGCRSLDSLAVIPEQIRGLPVTEVAPYAFSVHKAAGTEVQKGSEVFWWDAGEDMEIPLLEGNRLKEARFPKTLQKVGAYAFYNCECLRKIELYSTTLDWGAGVFAGCRGIQELVFHADEERKSCMKEILAELRQTLDVRYLKDGPEDSGSRTSLVFPEYFEEAVENTPARILVTETHGCGQRYRNAFVGTQFQFKEYDSLFAHVQVQEPEALVARLALGRVMYPYQLEDRYRRMYLDYLGLHGVAAAVQSLNQGDMNQLKWLFENTSYDGNQVNQLLETAEKAGSGEAVSYLMEQKRKTGTVKRKTFSL